MKTDPTFWVVARAGGLTAYLLLTLSVVFGLVVKSRPVGFVRPTTMTEAHRFITVLALSATAVHGIALALDTKIPFEVKELLVPGIAPYRALWVGVGIVAAELMLVIHLSFSLKRWIGTKNWRRLHWLTYGVFVAATLHGVMTGSDSDRAWVVAIYLACIGTVAALTAWRATAPPARVRSKKLADAEAWTARRLRAQGR
jgi:sulfoxide reductase heme-binding subunit YedZ